MSPPRATRAAGKTDAGHERTTQRLAAGKLDAVEEAWLARLEEAPGDLGYFVAVARSLEKSGEAETARFLLELLDEQLSDGGRWHERLELLRQLGHLVTAPEDRHAEIVATLDELYGDRPSYRQLADKVGLHRAVDDVPKTWKKVERLNGLLDFDVGSIVRMEGKGAGRVVEVNMELESFRIEFDSGLDLRVGFGGAAKLLSALPEPHVLRRALEHPEELEKLRDEAPGELLKVAFESEGRPLTGAELKHLLATIVPEKKWPSWWTAARKHPQVVASPDVKRAYTWAASAEDAHGTIWQSFEAADTRGRIDLLRRDGGRDPELKSRMAEALCVAAAKDADRDPGLACEIWFQLERAGVEPRAADWSPEKLIGELKDPRPLFAGIRDRALRERAYAIARDQRDDWAQLFARLLWQEQDARALDFLSEKLIAEAPERFDRFFDRLISQPRKNPAAFVWLAERAAERPEWLERNPIRLLKQIMWASTNDDFASFRAARLVPLADSGGTLPRLLSHLAEDQAADALEVISKSPGLQSYQRRPLRNAIELRFPSLREDGEAALYATQAQIKAKKRELQKIAEKDIPQNRRAIQEAREMGDLRENFEYKAARQRHEYLSARATALSQDLARVRPIDASQVTGDEVVIGSRVRLVASSGGDDRTITLLGPWESEPEKDVLSNESELAQRLLGLARGAEIELEGTSYRVESIEPWE